MNSQSASSPVW
jgi:transposase